MCTPLFIEVHVKLKLNDDELRWRWADELRLSSSASEEDSEHAAVEIPDFAEVDGQMTGPAYRIDSGQYYQK